MPAAGIVPSALAKLYSCLRGTGTISQYVTGGYSVSVRALSSAKDRVTGFSNLLFTRNFDNAMRKLLKEKWYNYKVKTAFTRADKAIQKLEEGSK